MLNIILILSVVFFTPRIDFNAHYLGRLNGEDRFSLEIHNRYNTDVTVVYSFPVWTSTLPLSGKPKYFPLFFTTNRVFLMGSAYVSGNADYLWGFSMDYTAARKEVVIKPGESQHLDIRIKSFIPWKHFIYEFSLLSDYSVGWPIVHSNPIEFNVGQNRTWTVVH